MTLPAAPVPTATRTPILEMDATQIAREIRERRMTCLEAVTAFITHIQHINPYINALVEDRFDAALEEAQEKDRQIEDGTASGVLFGVPISVKEAFDVAGMRTTGGLLKLRDVTASEDATIVKRLKDAGAIILGKTNTPELCFCQETENKLYGRTNNPWDLSRSAGGSSGGEGALIAAGGTAVGVGSDIGGSIRFPSHFNGIIGFKSGKDQISGAGTFPVIEHPLQTRMGGFGPMGRTVADIRLVYDLIAEQQAEPKQTGDLQIDVLPTGTQIPLSDKSADLLESVAAFLHTSFTVRRTQPPYFTKSARLWQEMMSIDGGKEVAAIASPSADTRIAAEFVKEKFAGTSTIHPYLSWALIGARLFKPSRRRRAEIEATLAQGDPLLEEYLENRVLVFPVYHTAALPHGRLYKEIFSLSKGFLKFMPFTAYANVWGLPALVIPVGTDEHNMPVAVQLISKNGNEDLLFQIGEQLEKEFGGYTRCRLLDY